MSKPCIMLFVTLYWSQWEMKEIQHTYTYIHTERGVAGN